MTWSPAPSLSESFVPPPDVVTAHGAVLRLADAQPASRSERERTEEATLSRGATVAHGAGRRRIAEEPDPFRTCFGRDRDRILHSSAFRRLAGKTQVFVFPGDHQRTRLTHALEVAQVATAIARACRLNVALTEAIALGHDCGHGPFGHASEGALSPFLPDGFDHAVWGADVVGASLNLCEETLDGIRNHSWRRPAPATPEAEVVAWADRIAYVCHDFEDAVAAGVVAPSDLPTVVSGTCGTTQSSQLAAFINGAIDTICTTGVIGMDPARAEALDAFRTFNFERIYLRPASVTQARAVTTMLRALVEHLDKHPPPATAPVDGGTIPGDGIETAVAYVAGMTDRFACRLAVRELDWPLDQLPRGFDLFS
jgi:dGTPase